MDSINISILDAGTLGEDIDFSLFEKYGRVDVYSDTDERQIRFRVMDADVIIVNKLPINERTLGNAHHIKLVCVTATGYDNIDIEYCKRRNIAVCNVCGYSSESVSQVTVAMALSLVNNLKQYDRYVKEGLYTRSGKKNQVVPVFHEMSTLTWGIVGLGAIGKRTAEIAKTMGCKVIAFKRRPDPLYDCVSLEKLCSESDIISIHIPYTDSTHKIISEEMISKMKNTAIVINVARGAVVDEDALARAILENRIGGLGIDVYSTEPLGQDSPYNAVLGMDNVIMTPHMAWGAYEARVRCMTEIDKNIDAFYKGGKRNRVDI